MAATKAMAFISPSIVDAVQTNINAAHQQGWQTCHMGPTSNPVSKIKKYFEQLNVL